MRKKKLFQQGINRGNALTEIEKMLNRADAVFGGSRGKANDLVRKARRIAMKFRMRMPAKLKRRYCKHCNSFWKHGVNVRVRTRSRMIVYYCMECRRFTKVGLRQKVKRQAKSGAAGSATVCKPHLLEQCQQAK